MTSQTKKFIELTDISGIKVQCRKCNVAIMVGDDRIMSVTEAHASVLFECPACGAGWTLPPRNASTYPGSEMGYDKEIKGFLRTLINMRDYEKKLGCALTLEIKNEPKQEQ